MRLLVVTPTLGASPYLASAVQSVAQTTLEIEHVLVSPPHVAARLAREYPQCHVIAEPAAGGGMYAAINAGITAAGSWDWFTYLNDDDVLEPGFAAMAHRHMARRDPRAIAYGDVRWIDENGSSLGRMPLERSMRHMGHVMKLALAPLTQQGALTSHELCTDLGGFDMRFRLAGDFDFWARAWASGARFQYYPGIVASWRIHAGQASHDRTVAHAEAHAIATAVPLHASSLRLWYELWRFRTLNASRYLERVRRTGAWRGEAVFRSAKSGSLRG
jgi:GT2 family glycosyltransferase